MGLLLAYFYEPDQDVGRYAYYGAMGLRHRGSRLVYAAHVQGAIRVGRISLRGEPRLPRSQAIAAGVEPSARLGVASAGGLRAAALVDGPCPAQGLARVMAEKGAREAAEEIAGGESQKWCAAVVIRSDGSFAAGRGFESRRPLSIGGYGFEALYAATESAPIALMGGSRRYDLGGGEAVYGNRYGLDIVRLGGRRRTSLFEYIYMARPDSIVDGVSVYRFRVEMGRRLAARHRVDVDVVAGVPETAMPYAIGYARAKGAALEYAFVSTLGRVRTALQPVTLEERLMMLSLKLSPVPGVFEDKSVAIVDDSVVTGLTLKTLIQRLRRIHGAREVHVAVSSPKIVRGCRYGLQPVDEEDLIAARLGDDELERVLDADSIAWLSLRDALDFLRRHGVDPCHECMR